MNMKNAFLLAVATLAMACDSSPKPVVNTNASANSAQQSERTETVTAHTTENATPPIPSNKSIPESPQPVAMAPETSPSPIKRMRAPVALVSAINFS